MANHSEHSYLRNDEPLDVPYTTLPKMILRHSIRDPSSVAHVYINWTTMDKEYLTFSDIHDRAKSLAQGLMTLGIEKGDVIALGTDNTPEWMVAMIGIQMSGAVPLMFLFDRKDGSDIESHLLKFEDKCKAIMFTAGHNGEYISIIENKFRRGEEKGRIVNSSLPSLRWAIVLSETESKHHLTFKELCKIGNPEMSLPYVDPEDVAAVFMSSGTTDHPKLIPHTHFSLLILGFYRSIGHGRRSKSLLNDRPFNWIAGYPCWETFTGGQRTLIKHISQIPSEEMYKDVLKKILKQKHFTSLIILSDVLKELIEDQTTVWRFQNVQLTGNPVPLYLSKRAAERCERFTVRYGTSEMSTITICVIDTNKEFLDYQVGTPSPGAEVKVVNDAGQLARRGERGELYIRSPVRFLGYLGDREKTAAACTESGWYKTGDNAVITTAGNLIVDGRLCDSMVKTGDGPGFHSVAKLEAKLKEHPGVEDAAVITSRSMDNFRQVFYAVVPKQGATVTDTMLKDFFLDPEHRMVDLWQKILYPKHFIFFDSFPKTYNGKVSRKMLSNMCHDRLSKMPAS